jgi:hypothetical protein
MVFRAILTRSHVEYYLSMEVTGFSETLVTTHNVDGVVTQKTTAIVLFKICLFKSRVATQMLGCDSLVMVRELQK